jgi:hypothetical protein
MNFLHTSGQMEADVVPDQHDRAPGLDAGADDQVAEVPPAEALRFVLTAAILARRPGLKQTMPAIDTRPEPRTRKPAPARPGPDRSDPRSWHAAESSTVRPRPRRGSRRRAPPRCSYPRPGLLLPHLDASSSRSMARVAGCCRLQPCRFSNRYVGTVNLTGRQMIKNENLNQILPRAGQADLAHHLRNQR